MENVISFQDLIDLPLSSRIYFWQNGASITKLDKNVFEIKTASLDKIRLSLKKTHEFMSYGYLTQH